MFRLSPAPMFPLIVPLHIPGQAGLATLELVAKHKTRKELNAWLRTAKDRTDAEFLLDVIAGWGPTVVDAQDRTVPFSAEAFAKLLDDYPAASQDIYNRYLAELSEARAKNA